jgi:hypothetical protein
MSAPPKCSVATANILSSWAQSRTSVFWKTALGVFEVFEPVSGYRDTNCSASGLRAKSASITLHPLLSSNSAKQKLIPEPAPVMIAVLPSTFSAMANNEEKTT